MLNQPDDGPTIGLLLCRGKQHVAVEYALRGMTQPLGVADWETQLVNKLPESLAGSLPTVEQLEAELSAAETEKQPTKRKTARKQTSRKQGKSGKGEA